MIWSIPDVHKIHDIAQSMEIDGTDDGKTLPCVVMCDTQPYCSNDHSKSLPANHKSAFIVPIFGHPAG